MYKYILLIMFVMVLLLIGFTSVLKDQKHHTQAKLSCEYLADFTYLIDRNNIGHCVRN
jgi:hypothetical protein